MSIGRITKRSVDALRCPANQRVLMLWDQDLRRFGIFAYPSGTKIYKLQFVFAGEERRMRIGAHGVFTPDEARNEAKRILYDVDCGKDPQAGPSVPAAIPTFNELTNAFMTDIVENKREETTRLGYESLLRVHIRPSIGDLPVTEVTTQRLICLHRSRKDNPGSANRMLSLISSIWNYSRKVRADRHLFKENPVQFVEKYPEEQATRFLSMSEMRRFGDALVRAELGMLTYEVDEDGPNVKHAPKPENRRQKVDPFAVAALRLLLLTGARLNEILKAHWDWVDWEGGAIILPRSKRGKKPKPIVLSTIALDILRELPRVVGHGFIIVGKIANKPRSDLKRPWAAIIKAADIEDITLHGLRHSFASAAARQRLGLPMIGALLGHTQAQTTKRYAHLDLEPMREAVEIIALQINGAMASKNAYQALPKPALK